MLDKSMTIGKVICTFPDDSEKRGTGFFVGDKGYLITNNHIIRRIYIIKYPYIHFDWDYSEQIYVKLGQDCYEASLAIDPYSKIPFDNDYAILKLDFKPKGYDIDSMCYRDVSQGEEVIAMGYPYNSDELVITSGIISAITIKDSNTNSACKIKTFLTNTNVTHGFSGGPLIRKSDNKLIGINTDEYNLNKKDREELKEHQDVLKRYNLDDLRSYLHDSKLSSAIEDLIKSEIFSIDFSLKNIQIGINHAYSMEYVMEDSIFKKGE